mmetsp:Transcript_81024/g.217469  ORF Transcript_81024/g.217469 Transcript_81024/m.217469 type:complete len:164 (+) Transcript_81024:2334-2825(+)
MGAPPAPWQELDDAAAAFAALQRRAVSAEERAAGRKAETRSLREQLLALQRLATDLLREKAPRHGPNSRALVTCSTPHRLANPLDADPGVRHSGSGILGWILGRETAQPVRASLDAQGHTGDWVTCGECGLRQRPGLVFARGPHHGRRCRHFAWQAVVNSTDE